MSNFLLKLLCQSSFSQAIYKSISPQPCQQNVLYFLTFVSLIDKKWYLTLVLIYVSLTMTFFIYLRTVLYFLGWIVSSYHFPLFLLGFFSSFCPWFWRSLYILGIYLLQILSPSLSVIFAYGGLFVCLFVLPCIIFIFMWSDYQSFL